MQFCQPIQQPRKGLKEMEEKWPAMYSIKCGHHFGGKHKHTKHNNKCREINFFWGVVSPWHYSVPLFVSLHWGEGDIVAARNVKLMMPRTPWWDLWYLGLIPGEMRLLALWGALNVNMHHCPLQTRQRPFSLCSLIPRHGVTAVTQSTTTESTKQKAAHTTHPAYKTQAIFSYSVAY